MGLRSVLKNYFLTGNKPTQAQYHDVIDSLAHKSEDFDKLGGGLKPHSSVRPYKAGEAFLKDGEIRIAKVDQTGAYDANLSEPLAQAALNSLGLAAWNPTTAYVYDSEDLIQVTHRLAILEATANSQGIEPFVDPDWEDYWQVVVYTDGGLIPVYVGGGFVKADRVYSYQGEDAAKGLYRCMRSDVGFDGGFKSTDFAAELADEDWRLEAVAEASTVLSDKFVGLISQAGESDPQTMTSGTLTIGVTYEITNFNPGDDFLNVGAPFNDSGAKFVATGTTPTNWSGSSLLTYDPGAPTVVVLENGLGPVWFEILGDGDFAIKSDGLFTNKKTGMLIGPLPNDLIEGFAVSMAFANSSTISILTYANGGSKANELLSDTMIEVRVYQ